MTVIGVNGSPSGNGNTATLVTALLAGAEEVGAPVHRFDLGRMDYAPCIACMGCRESAECVLRDDMQDFYAAVRGASAPKGLVVGTPIYFDHVSGQLKAWLDRLYCFTYTELGQVMFPQGFRAVLVGTWEWDKEDAYAHVIDWLEERLSSYHQIDTVGRVTACGTGSTPARDRADLLERARELGRALAED